jgi:membrane protein DedA with SNARE-associated domain
MSTGGYIILFGITVLEGLPILGTLVPGHISIILAGFMARIGTLDLLNVIIVASLGSILGDYIGYSFGRRYGLNFIHKVRKYFFVSELHIDKARAIIGKHTGKALVFGRFSPMTRALIPFLIGSSGIHQKKFWLFDIVGAIIWTTLSIMVGYVFGEGYRFASTYLGKYILIAVVVAILIIWGYRFVNRRFHVFAKYELIVLFLNLIALWGLAESIEDIWSLTPFMAGFDVWVNTLVNNHLMPALVFVSKIISYVGGTVSVTILSVLVCLYFLRKKSYKYFSLVFVSMAVTIFTTGMMKEIFMRVRPQNAIVDMMGDPSFPSAHASFIAVFVFVLLYIFAPKIRSLAKREWLIVIGVVVVAAVGLSRIFLSVHWFSDVLAGWSLGIFVTSSTILFIRYASMIFRKKNLIK